MRKSVIILVLLALSVQNPQRVEAGAFATEVTQLLNHAQLVLQYIRQGTQLANELNMYADMLKNSRMLSAHTFGAIMNDVNALAAIVQGGQALAYSLGNLDQLFRQTYPGYGYNAGAYYTQYRNWSQTSLDTTLGTLRAAGMQGQQLQSEQAVVASLRSSLGGHRWPAGSPARTGRHLGTAGRAVDEVARADDGGHVQQAGLPGDHDPTASCERSRGAAVFHVHSHPERQQGLSCRLELIRSNSAQFE